MVESTVPSPAANLFAALDPRSGARAITDAQADHTWVSFLADMRALDARQNPEAKNPKYLAEQVFGRARLFKNRIEELTWCRCQLHVAVKQLGNLDRLMRGQNGGIVTLDELRRCQDTIRDYLFDLLDIVPVLEPAHPMFRGGKDPTVHSWRIYQLAGALAYQSGNWENGPLEHKPAQIASIFILRQAMELRFERLVGVHPRDAKGKSPRLKHGFHQDFIQARPYYFKARSVDFAQLRNLYDWCSEIVHVAYQPFAWQIAWAFELADQLLGSTPSPPGEGRWSIANGVEVVDVEKMQAEFEEHFLSSYEHGSWQMTRVMPEALVKNWTLDMAGTSTDFRPVRTRRSWWRDLRHQVKRLFKP